MNIQVKLIITKEEFNRLEPEWNPLLQDSQANNIFLTWEWISTWWEFFGNERQLMVLVAKDEENGRVTGIAPLNTYRTRLAKFAPISHKELGFIGANLLAPDHLDFILRKDYESIVTPLFMKYISNHINWDILRFDGLTSESSLVPYLESEKKIFGWHKSKLDSVIARLPDSWKNYRSQLSKNMRKNIDRYAQRLEEEYANKTRVVSVHESDNVEEHISDVLRLASKVKISQHEKYSLADTQLSACLKTIAKKFHTLNWLQGSKLMVMDKVVAANMVFLYNNVASFYQSGYDLEWKEYSPGQQIRGYGIQQAISLGAKEVDFLRGGEFYKNKWGNDFKSDYYFKIGSNIKGDILVTLYSFAWWVRNIFGQIIKKS